AVEIVHHQKAALQQIVVQTFGFGGSKCPIFHIDGVHPRVVENFIVVEINHLLGGSRIYARQAAQCQQELPVGLRVILAPGPSSAISISSVAEATAAAVTAKAPLCRRESQPRPGKLRLLAALLRGDWRVGAGPVKLISVRLEG